MKDFFRKKVVDPILMLLKQGITPEKIALCMAIGIVIGIFPVIGATTLLCAIAAIVLRLNLPAMQIVNYMAYPLQIALLIPFFQFGAWLFGMEPLPLSAQDLIAMFKADFWGAISQLWGTTLRAIVAWGLICLPTAAALYYILRPVIRKMAPGRGRQSRGPSDVEQEAAECRNEEFCHLN